MRRQYRPVLNISFPKDEMIVIDFPSLEDLDSIDSEHRYVITVDMIVDGRAQNHYFVFKDSYVYRYTSQIE